MAKSISLQLEKYLDHIKLVKKGNKTYVWDVVRKKYIVLEPEEMVRQLFIHYLVEELNYPKTSIAVEKKIKTGRTYKRFDLVVYNSSFTPCMLIECKSFDVSLSNTTFLQSAIYNKEIKAEYICITNGRTAYCCSLDHEGKDIHFCCNIPSFH